MLTALSTLPFAASKDASWARRAPTSPCAVKTFVRYLASSSEATRIGTSPGTEVHGLSGFGSVAGGDGGEVGSESFPWGVGAEVGGAGVGKGTAARVGDAVGPAGVEAGVGAGVRGTSGMPGQPAPQ